MMREGDYRPVPELTGRDVRAADLPAVPFPELLAHMDDLPPATMITRVHRVKARLVVRGISHDDGEITRVTVNGRPASAGPGTVDWEASVELPRGGTLIAKSADRAGNEENPGHALRPR